MTLELRRLAKEHHDNCCRCDWRFRSGETCHLGYDASGSPLIVCDRCVSVLAETALRQMFSERAYRVPSPGCVLWRYMDFTRYVSLLSSAALHFPRADRFDDIFEGAKGVRANKSNWDRHYLEWLRAAIRNPPPGHSCTLSDEEVEQEAHRLLADLEASGKAAKTHTFISCWHANEHESEAMWRLYSSFLPNAIAIRTTSERLEMALGRDPSIELGHVEYIDLKSVYAGVNDAFWRKHISYTHECEVRAIHRDHECEGIGKAFPCNLSTLIDAVFVSPKAPVWFRDLVNSVNAKYSIGVAVAESELVAEPFF
jgi:hypothetical protein